MKVAKIITLDKDTTINDDFILEAGEKVKIFVGRDELAEESDIQEEVDEVKETKSKKKEADEEDDKKEEEEEDDKKEEEEEEEEKKKKKESKSKKKEADEEDKEDDKKEEEDDEEEEKKEKKKEKKEAYTVTVDEAKINEDFILEKGDRFVIVK